VPTDIKIAIIGAGSATFSSGIVRDICVTPGLHGSHVELMDVDEKRLDMIALLAERITKELGVDLTFAKTTDREAALQGADFVINTALDGGHDWVEAQRDLSEKHGYYRGAWIGQIGQVAFLLEVARDIERICPNAWLVQSSNPVFEGCTLIARETGIKFVGLCHGHYGYEKVARVMGLDLEHVSALMPGFNHWIWMTDFRYHNEDAYPLLDEWIETKAEAYWAETDSTRGFADQQMSRAAIHQYQLMGCMPIGDTPRKVGWWYHTDLETKKQWYGHQGGFDSEVGWAIYLESRTKQVERIEQLALDESKRVTDSIKPVQSHEQIIPIIDALVNDVPGTYQVNIPNRGPLLPGFPEDLVVECQAVVSGAGIRGIAVPPLPSKLMAGTMIPRWRCAEQVVEAVRTGDRDLLLIYLLEDHRTRSLSQAEKLLDEWLADPRAERLARRFGNG